MGDSSEIKSSSSSTPCLAIALCCCCCCCSGDYKMPPPSLPASVVQGDFYLRLSSYLVVLTFNFADNETASRQIPSMATHLQFI